MASARTLLRVLRIQRVLVKYGLDEVITATHLLRPLRFLYVFFPKRRDSTAPLGERLRLALEELGPIFVKFGQAVSTRRDLLPRDIADELAKLQDNVPPFPSDQAVRIIEDAYGKSVEEVFERFDREPLAAASIAQVHTAKIANGTEVIVKILRPGVEEQIEQDLAVLRWIAHLAAKYWEHGKRLRPLELVSEYERTVIDELDLMREAANTAQLRRNFEGSDLLVVPEIYWDYCRPEVLVQERIYGIPISDMDALRAAGTNIKALAENGVEIFFTQVFRHNFFHADMHPGNIFVDATDPADPTYISVDCAIVGSLSDADQYYLGRNLLGIFRRDYREVAQLHVECGWVPPQTRVQDFESAMRAVCEPIFERPISQISFGLLLVHLFQTASRFDMEVQPSLVLLQKTLLNIEGLGRQLYPDLNLWNTAQPFLEEWVQQRYSPQSVLKRLQRHAPSWIEQLPLLPEAMLDSLQQSRDTRRHLPPLPEQQSEQQGRQGLARRRRYLLAGAAFLGAAATAVPDAWQYIANAPLASWVLAGLGVCLLWSKDR